MHRESRQSQQSTAVHRPFTEARARAWGQPRVLVVNRSQRAERAARAGRAQAAAIMNGNGAPAKGLEGAINHAEELRNEGNAHFKHGDYEKALDSFSRSLFAEESHLTYANRSLVFNRLRQYEAARKDAERALQIEPTAKGYYRLATALVALGGRHREVVRACERGLQFGPSAELVRMRDEARRALGGAAEASDSEEGDSDDDDEDEEDEVDDDDDDDDDDSSSEPDDEDEEAEAEAEAARAEERARSFEARRAKLASARGAGETGGSAMTEEEEAEVLAERAAARAKSFDKRAHAAAATPVSAAPPPPLESAAECKEKGNALYKAQEYALALEWYAKAAQRASSEGEKALYLCNRAAALLMLSRPADAVEDAGRALKLDQGLAKAHARKGKGLLQLGQLTEARLALTRAAELSPGNASIEEDLRLLGMAQRLSDEVSVHAERGEHEKLLSLVRLLRGRYCPAAEQLRFVELDAVVKLGRYDEVLSQATAMLRESPDSPNALYLRGRCLFHNGQLDAALKHATEALRLDPDHGPSKGLRVAVKGLSAAKEAGNDAFKARDFAKAVEHYTTALGLAGERDAIVVTLRTNRATAHARLRQHAEAVADCTAALGLEPKCAKAILRRAACRMELEQFDKAMEDYKLAEQHAPDEDSAQQARQLGRKAKLEKLKSEREDLYGLLELPKTASSVEIKKAYRKMALKWHPDKNAGSEEERLKAEAQFKKLNDAYEVLSTPEKRERYDSGADLEEQLDGHRGGGHSHVDPEMFNMFQSFMGGGMGGMPRGGRHRHGGGGGGRYGRNPYGSPFD